MIRSFLKKKFPGLYFFYQYLRYRIVLMLGFSFLMVLADSIGLAMFIPLLSVADSSQKADTGNKVITIVRWVFAQLHIEFAVPGLLVVIVFLFLLKAVCFYYATRYLGVSQQVFSQIMRRRLASGLSTLQYREFVKTDVGRLQNSLTGETWQVVYACSQYLETIKNGLFILLYLSFAFFIDWKFSLLVAAGGGATNLLYKYFYRQTQALSKRVTSGNHNYNGLVTEVVHHYKYLKATARISGFVSRLNNELARLVKSSTQIIKLQAKLSALREPMMIFVICIVIAIHVLVFHATLASVILILVFFYRVMQKIVDVQSNWNNYLAATGSIDNLKSYQQYLDRHTEPFFGDIIVKEVESITLDNASLLYDDIPALEGITITIEKNTSVAFVGESGSGKTSLINLLSGLLIQNEGSFTINGIDFKKVDVTSFRERIGYVTQEPTIFNATVFENVTYWAEPTVENIQRFEWSITICNLNDFIAGQPNGLNTMLGANGVNISGGQRQRISIARELFRDIDLLIMDEATSALDSQTELVIKQGIEKLQGRLTIMSIAHRLSTIQHADVIYVMDKGRIVDSGTFAELQQKNQYFKKLTSLQGM